MVALAAERFRALRVLALALRASVTRATLVLCALPILLVAVLAYRYRWVTDDAFIDLRVVANIHHGLGPVFNAGERVEVFTSPLWVALLWAVSSVARTVPLEWDAVVLGALTSLTGMVAAARGAWLLWGGHKRPAVAVPAGLVVLVAVRPVWDFVTSGLETGLVFAWLGVSFWALAALQFRPPTARREGRWRRLLPGATPTPIALLISLGALVRPDLAIFSVGFLVMLLLAPEVRTRGARFRLVLWTLAVPVAYQLFRMGYFAALEPNTALAKEAGTADWSRGFSYLKDFVGPYYLYLPLLGLGALAAIELRGPARHDPGIPRLALCAVVCAGLHALYIVRVGGDFMHARMLLPSLFGALLPVAVIIPRWRGSTIALGLLVLTWAIVSFTALRTPYAGRATYDVIGDERAFYVAFSQNPNPVTLSDYRGVPWAQTGAFLHRLALGGGRALLEAPKSAPLEAASGVPVATAKPPVVVGAVAIGILGYAAGPGVRIVDLLGLADPLASRTRLEAITLSDGTRNPARHRPGHDKELPVEWMIARFAPAYTTQLSSVVTSPAWVQAARAAVQCPETRRLLEAVDAPMSLSRFLSNVGASFDLTSLRFSADPVRGKTQLCSHP